MNKIIMSIIAVTLLSTLIELLIAEGETKKYVKGIVAILTVMVILQPLITVIDKDFDIDFGQEEEGELNESYLDRIYKERYKNIEINLQKKLSLEGYKSVIIRIDIECNNYSVEVKQVNVNIKNLIITNDKPNININKEIKDTIKEALNISEDKIIINE